MAPEATDPRPSVSVVVLSKDEPQLAHTLDLLRPQCDAIDAECLVVDASMGRMEHVHRDHAWVEWIDFVGPMCVKVTIPHQRNAGVRRAKGRIVAFCDAGGSPQEGWLDALIQPLLAGTSEATCGPIFPLGGGMMDPANDLDDGAPVEIAITANMAFLRRAFDLVGGFDERYRYGSDTDFGFRLLDAGCRMTCAAGARMVMDWGDTDRALSRARFYGAGNVLLFLNHPRRVRTVLRLWPDTVAYPIWLVGMVLLVPFAVVALWLPLGWLALLAVPLWRNRRAPNLGALLRVKLLRAASFLTGWVSVPLRRDVPVVIVPENHENPYLDELCIALQASGVTADQLPMGVTSSQTLNALLVLPRLAWRRLRGTRVLHVHWTYPFAWRWAARVPVLRRAPRWWFTALLSSARVLGLRVVYTAHNVLPHTPIFDDDRAARRALLGRADEVITLTDAARARLHHEFGVPAARLTVVPEGAPRPVAASLHAARSDRPLAVLFGHLDAYKGVEVLLDAAVTADEDLGVELLGESSDPAYAELLHRGLERLRASGRHAVWAERRFTDEELACLLARATMAVLPFREITNSTSLRVAMTHRVPCVLPALPALSDVPRAAACWFAPADVADLARALRDVAAATDDEREAMSAAALAWLAEWSWDRVAAATRQVYERALR
ncbi:MAG TPA: glycosyltransferase [Acidimicrobiales bacterium]|nr:glycosyltransferase [Acidimicrobiales bacterium]